MVKTRPSSEHGKHPTDAPGAPAGSDDVEKCVNCQYYDRQWARPTWGQCRRHSPHLNPVTAKAYVVEGVWPLVRDDDWCGEWKVLTCMPEEPLPESAVFPAGDAPPARGRPVTASVIADLVAGDD